MNDENRVNGVEVLSNLSGLSRHDIQQIWIEVKENQSKLNGCPRPHDFQTDVTMTEREQRMRLRCTTCGGALDTPSVSWYMKGLEDGRRQVVTS